MENLKIEFGTYTRLGCPFEVRVYNLQEKKLDPRTISEYFIGHTERSIGHIFYHPCHSTRIVESRNAKFLENDLIRGRIYLITLFLRKIILILNLSPQVMD